MERTRGSFTSGAAAAGGIAGMSGTALARCKDPPGNEYGQAKGHDKDEGDSGGEAHDRDEDGENPGRRVGHCKYD